MFYGVDLCVQDKPKVYIIGKTLWFDIWLRNSSRLYQLLSLFING
jgi:hypothetical protein